MSAIPGSFDPIGGTPFPWRIYTPPAPGSGNAPVQPPGDQWLRKWGLLLSGSASGESLSLSTSDAGFDIRIKFTIRQADAQTPNTAIIRVYNLSDATALKAVKEFYRVTLEAGYTNGRYGTIFDGEIKQFKKGRESPTDTYLDIYAADGGMAYNESTLNTVLPSGWTEKQRYQALAGAWRAQGIQVPSEPEFNLSEADVPNPGPRVLFGANADETRAFAKDNNLTWSIVNGKLVITPVTGYASGDIVVLNSSTGMIGFPEATNEGIYVSCLLNPSIQLRQRIRLDNKSINFYFAPGGSPTGQAGVVFPGYQTGVNYFPSPATDGIYCALVIDYEGDTRGIPWYDHIICLAVDPSSGQGSSIKALG